MAEGALNDQLSRLPAIPQMPIKMPIKTETTSSQDARPSHKQFLNKIEQKTIAMETLQSLTCLLA
jgi:hypothetical protein